MLIDKCSSGDTCSRVLFIIVVSICLQTFKDWFKNIKYLIHRFCTTKGHGHSHNDHDHGHAHNHGHAHAGGGGCGHSHGGGGSQKDHSPEEREEMRKKLHENWDEDDEEIPE